MSNIYLHSYLEPRIIRLGYKKISDFVNRVVAEAIKYEEALSLTWVTLELACKKFDTKAQKLKYLSLQKSNLESISAAMTLDLLQIKMIITALDKTITAEMEED